MDGKCLALSVTPLQVRRAEETFVSDTQKKERELQIISTSTFTLPDDWIVEEKPRPYTTGRSRHIDRYYYEPGTGRKFRSLISVKRYLYGEEREVLKTEILKSENENEMQIVRQTGRTTTFFELPDNWIVEEKPCTNVNNAVILNRSYIEPRTGQRFRSLRAVQRYLNEENTSTAKPKSLQKSGCGKKRAAGKNCSLEAASNCSTVVEEDRLTPKAMKLAIHSEQKINLGKDSKASMLEYSSQPAKVKWVLSGSGGLWSPFLNNSVVPESVKLKWSEAFILSTNAGDRGAPNC